MNRIAPLTAALFLLGGCVQTNSVGSYSSVSTVSYGNEQTLVRTVQEQWQNQDQQSPAWQAQITPAGSSIQINATPPPRPVNVIVVPAQAPCYNAPHIVQGTLWPTQRPCR